MKTVQFPSIPVERTAECMAAQRHYRDGDRREALAALGTTEDAVLEAARDAGQVIAEALAKGDPALLLRFARAYFRTERRLYLRAPRARDLRSDATLTQAASPAIVPVGQLSKLPQTQTTEVPIVELAVPTYLFEHLVSAEEQSRASARPMPNVLTEELSPTSNARARRGPALPFGGLKGAESLDAPEPRTLRDPRQYSEAATDEDEDA